MLRCFCIDYTCIEYARVRLAATDTVSRGAHAQSAVYTYTIGTILL